MSALLHQARALRERGQPWAGLGGDALAFVLAQLCPGGRWLVVVDEPDRADAMVRALRFLHPDPSQIAYFAVDDARPYDGFSPSAAAPRARLHALHRVDAGRPSLVVASARALLKRVPGPADRVRLRCRLKVGQRIDRADLARWLRGAGYLAAEHAVEEGFFAVRGDVVDVWPAGRSLPFRIDFFDDEIEAIRSLDPSTRRSVDRREGATLLAAREELLDERALRRAQAELARHAVAQGVDGRLRRRVLEDLRAGIRFAGLQDWLPALVEVQDPLDAFAGFQRVIVHPEDVAAVIRDGARTIQDRYRALDLEDRPIVPPESTFCAADDVLAALESAQVVQDVPRDRRHDLGARRPDGLAVRGVELAPVVARLRELAEEGVSVGIVCATDRRVEHLRELLGAHGLFPDFVPGPSSLPPSEVSLLLGDLPRGFVAEDAKIALIPDTSLFGHRARRAVADRIHAFFDAGLTEISQIKEGDYVVHKIHGVGRYEGMDRMAVGASEQDYVRIGYRGGDMMYLPVARLGQLSRYVPTKEGAEVRLDRLGGQTWEARKGKVRDSLLRMAEELLRIHAARELSTRLPHAPAGDLYHAFVARFPYDETPDQALAIDAVMEDLSSEAPMDRLLCGDVGFGKTEVAMRAAARVVGGGRQVAVLCPTTVLAYQHRQTFAERFEGLPVRIGLLCRFNSPAEDKEVRRALRRGEIDIVIGTTALLGRGIRYADLGLMVVDEEHRFGVRQKERLKKLRAEVDVLSMSATPIPRTLQMGLSGMREMSLMSTPPRDRLAVRTSTASFKKARVRDAILLEIERGGQVFFVHNRVETLQQVADRLKSWVPEATFAVAHGQQSAQDLEDTLIAFTLKKVDVLVCTAIMETGIDLPNVNTMIVDRADRFGLAQLYQLRGRVGRGSVRAQCLLLLPEDATRDARRRVQVMVEHTSLGSGFQIAAADLEMRGAGNLLGEAQSGNIDAVGYEVWLELLEEAVQRAQGRLGAARVETEVEIPVPAFIPQEMVPDPQLRLAWYRRFSDAQSPAQVERALDELELEHGRIPVEVQNLVGLLITQLQGRQIGLTRISWLKVRVLFEFHPGSAALGPELHALVARMPKRLALEGGREDAPVVLSARFEPSEAERPFRFLRWLLAQLGARG
ncbi:MAG: transcription-repair coupling factor [Deltaproteobacteria bacterium]|nr:MAG: transcription-repair coupling factor [Deltaproteobacteria bacterium]